MDVKQALSLFDLGSPVVDIAENKIGHINNTYILQTEKGDRFVLQRINKNVFKRPEDVMHNFVLVTDHIRKKLADDPEHTTLQLVKSGENYYAVDPDGDYWRAYHYVEGECYQSCDSTALFEKVGQAFGRFQGQLADFDASLLRESLVNFHNTADRYRLFELSVAKDVAGRAASVADEIAFVRARREVCSYIVDGIANGTFPLRVTHNDTKLNNIIMNGETGEGRCVIDLDTVMPGSMLYDFGDAIRFGASSTAEDETDLSKVYFIPEMFEAFAKGYIDGLDGRATEAEILAFPESARIITLEIGIRFLTDYLDGDTYFRTKYATHNLDRARNQFKLVSDAEAKADVLLAIVKKFI